MPIWKICIHPGIFETNWIPTWCWSNLSSYTQIRIHESWRTSTICSTQMMQLRFLLELTVITTAEEGSIKTLAAGQIQQCSCDNLPHERAHDANWSHADTPTLKKIGISFFFFPFKLTFKHISLLYCCDVDETVLLLPHLYCTHIFKITSVLTSNTYQEKCQPTRQNLSYTYFSFSINISMCVMIDS